MNTEQRLRVLVMGDCERVHLAQALLQGLVFAEVSEVQQLMRRILVECEQLENLLLRLPEGRLHCPGMVQ